MHLILSLVDVRRPRRCTVIDVGAKQALLQGLGALLPILSVGVVWATLRQCQRHNRAEASHFLCGATLPQANCSPFASPSHANSVPGDTITFTVSVMEAPDPSPQSQPKPSTPEPVAEPVAEPAPGVLPSRPIPIAPAPTLPGEVSPSASRARAIQFVTTLADRRSMAEWMTAEVSRCGSEKHIASKVVREFPHLFPGNAKANLMRATRIWRQRAQLLRDASVPTPLKVSTRVQKHSLPGRGRKRAPWSDKLQTDLLHEFNRLKSAGFVFTPRSVRSAAVALVCSEDREGYGKDMKDPRSHRPLMECLTARWVRAFADRWQVTLDDRPVGTNVPIYKQRQLELDEKLIAYHLGCMARQLREEKLREDDVGVLAPIHFLLSTKTGNTLGFGEKKQPEFAEIIEGARPMTMLVRVSGGKDAKVGAPVMIFQDAERTYPIPGVADDVPDVCYRTSPTGWVDTAVLASCFGEGSGISSLPDGRKRVIFMEPSTWLPFAKELAKPLDGSNTELRFFPRNGGGLMQPVDTGIREKIKELWRDGWQQMKTRMIDLGVWNGEGRDTSGKMFNAGPRFFLKLAAAAIKAVNEARDEEGVSLTRKAMIRTGMSLNVNGKWELEQLHPELKAIAIKHKIQFDGEIVTVEEKPRPLVAQRQAEKQQTTQQRQAQQQATQKLAVGRRDVLHQAPQEQTVQHQPTKQKDAHQQGAHPKTGQQQATQKHVTQQQATEQIIDQAVLRATQEIAREESQAEVS